jgi:hypothetical protein
MVLALPLRRKDKMKRHPVLCTALWGLALSIPCFGSTQLLYVQHGQNLVTYSVNPTTAAATKLGSLALKCLPAYEIQVLHAPASPYVYVIGFTSKTSEFIWVYATTLKGVPIPGAIQTLPVKPALTQFVFHPNGNFAYAFYSWVTDFESAADVVLYTVNPKTGQLVNTKKPVANFPPNEWVAYTSLYGLNGKGTKMYIQQFAIGDADYYYPINPKTGLLGKQVWFWGDEGEDGVYTNSVFSDSLIAQALTQASGREEIDIFTNSNHPSKLFTCTQQMLVVCGDDSRNLKFDPSGKNLFIVSDTLHSVEIAAVKAKSLVPTDSIPGTPSTLTFSPDGKIVYAIEGKEVLIYIFHPATGLLGTKSSITVPAKFISIAPASQ